MEKKHFYYRKITPEIYQKIKKMREEGFSYEKIAKTFGLSQTAVIYHLNPIYRKKLIEKVAERLKKLPSSPEKRKYMREYILRRYKQDKTFREKLKELMRVSGKKRRKLIKQLRKKYLEYDQLMKEFYREKYYVGFKEAYSKFKEKNEALRKKYNVYFPLR